MTETSPKSSERAKHQFHLHETRGEHRVEESSEAKEADFQSKKGEGAPWIGHELCSGQPHSRSDASKRSLDEQNQPPR
ncbi:phytanoyl-CoA dioxygenase [Sesbania bispinosa]|nr:phytanoyl-CoA dioxygenase [Sesbania bispinosa]